MIWLNIDGKTSVVIVRKSVRIGASCVEPFFRGSPRERRMDVHTAVLWHNTLGSSSFERSKNSIIIYLITLGRRGGYISTLHKRSYFWHWFAYFV